MYSGSEVGRKGRTVELFSRLSTPFAGDVTHLKNLTLRRVRRDGSLGASMRADESEPGLCVSCVYRQRVNSRRGSAFVRCRKADEDPRFPKYPMLPVLKCEGYEKQPEAKEGEA